MTTRPFLSRQKQNPFSAWIRNNRDLDATTHNLAVSDWDGILHRWMTGADREVQLSMMLEAKAKSGRLTKSHQEVLFMHHQLLCTSGTPRKVDRVGSSPVSVWHFGVFVVLLDGEVPEYGGSVQWGQFDQKGRVQYERISTADLVLRMRLENRPDTGLRVDIRRHHKTSRVVVQEETPLGLSLSRMVTNRS